MKVAWIIPFIILGGCLQTIGGAMNGQLGKTIANPWLASAISFAIVTFFFVAFFIQPHPLPSLADIETLPWWAPVGGLVGAVQVYAGLRFIHKVGAGPFVGLTVTAALITSLIADHYGWFRLQQHPLNIWRVLGGALLVGGVSLIAKF
jgi:bacterial/archaeal transporter family-2 protein